MRDIWKYILENGLCDKIRVLENQVPIFRTALLARLKDIFRRHQSQPFDKVNLTKK